MCLIPSLIFFYTDGVAVYSPVFPMGIGNISLHSVKCAGTEAGLLHCPAGQQGRHACNHREDAGVRCWRDNEEQQTGKLFI